MTESNLTNIHDLEAAELFLTQMPGKLRNLGKKLSASGAVRKVQQFNQRRFMAHVQGDCLVQVDLLYANRQWASVCSCGAGLNCEHAYAAMASLLNVPEKADEPQSAKPASPLEQRLIESGWRKAPSSERRLLKTLQALFLRCQARGPCEAWELEQLGFTVYGY